MTNNEVNKIIAEFIFSDKNIQLFEDLDDEPFWGYEEGSLGFNAVVETPKYTESLDSQIPVWERLPCSISIYHLNGKYSVVTPFHTQLTQQDEKVSVTAAYATAKAILALKSDNTKQGLNA